VDTYRHTDARSGMSGSSFPSYGDYIYNLNCIGLLSGLGKPSENHCKRMQSGDV